MKVKGHQYYVNLLSGDQTEEKSSARASFHGFQTDRFMTGLATPEFASYMMKKETTARTEYVLKVANNKLQKALSHGYCNYNDVCSGEKLLRSEVKHNRRVTLRELFHKQLADEAKCNSKGKKSVADRSRKLMTKIVKRSRRSATAADSVTSSNEKLHKQQMLLQMFNLEALTISQNMWNYVNKKSKFTNDIGDHGSYTNCRHKMLPDDIIIFPAAYKSASISSANNTKRNVSHVPCLTNCSKTERWIKSDAEYLILEL